MVALSVLEKANDSEMGVTYFSQPKAKTNRVQLFNNFINLNRQIKRSPHPMPKISEILLKLEGFKHAIPIDLNMVYYHIRLS